MPPADYMINSGLGPFPICSMGIADTCVETVSCHAPVSNFWIELPIQILLVCSYKDPVITVTHLGNPDSFSFLCQGS